MIENDNRSYRQHHDSVREENMNEPAQSSGAIGIEDGHNSSDIANTDDIHNDNRMIQIPPPPPSNENTSTIIENTNNSTNSNTTTNSGGSNHDAYNYDEEFTTVSMSPDERNTFFPSSTSSRRTSLYEQHQQHQQQYYYNPTTSSSGGGDDHLLQHPTRPSRESVLQRLCEALLRRSLTKVCVSVSTTITFFTNE